MVTTQSSSLVVPKKIGWLALSMLAGQVLFTLAWFILGFLSPGFTIFGNVIKPYSPISAPLSGLGLGITGPYMNAAFLISGFLILLGVFGIFQNVPQISRAGRVACIAIFALSPLGMVVDGLFTIESFMPHMLGFLLGSAAPVIGYLVAGLIFRRIPGWQRLGSWLLIASPLTLGLLVLSLVTFNQAAVMAGKGIAGLTERILCVELAATFVALGLKAFRSTRTL